MEIESRDGTASNKIVQYDLTASDNSVSGGLHITLGSSPTYQLSCRSGTKPLTLTGDKWKYTLEKRTNSIAFYINGKLIENMLLTESADCTAMWSKTTTKFLLKNTDTASVKVVFLVNGTEFNDIICMF